MNQTYGIARLVVPLTLGLVTALAINYKVTNYYVMLAACIGFFAVPIGIIQLLTTKGFKGNLRIFGLQCLAFFIVTGIGIGIFYCNLRNLVGDIDSRRAEITAALQAENPSLPGICFYPKNKNGSRDISPCWSNDVVVYYTPNDYDIVIPVTRPLPLSFTSFKVLTWDAKLGWNMDRISWSLESI